MFVDWVNIFFLPFLISWHTHFFLLSFLFPCMRNNFPIYPQNCHHHELWAVMNFSNSQEEPQINDVRFFKKKIINWHIFVFPFTFFSIWEWLAVVIEMSNPKPFIKCKPKNVLWNLTMPFLKGITFCQKFASTPAIDILQVSDVFSGPFFLTFGSNKSYCLLNSIYMLDTLLNILQTDYSMKHFLDKETEAYRGQEICPRWFRHS